MRQVKLTTSRVLSTGRTQEYGDTIEVSDEEAAALIAANQALPIAAAADVRGSRARRTSPPANSAE